MRATRFLIALSVAASCAALVVLLFWASSADAQNEDVGGAHCVPDSSPQPAIEVVEFGDVDPEVVTQSWQVAQERIISETGADFRWVCEPASIDAEPAKSAEEVRQHVLRERPDVGPRKYLTVAPISDQRTRGQDCGNGFQGDGHRAVAVVFNRCGQPLYAPSPTTGLHELMHTFGVGHINVEGDLMNEGRKGWETCPRTGRPRTLDCEDGNLYGLDLDQWLVRPAADAAPDTRVDRIGGSDRYLTSVEASREGHPISAPVAYVASGLSSVDALVAAGLPEDGPVLLTPPDHLHPAVADELDRLSPNRVIIVGGEEAVSEEVQFAIEAAVMTS